MSYCDYTQLDSPAARVQNNNCEHKRSNGTKHHPATQNLAACITIIL